MTATATEARELLELQRRYEPATTLGLPNVESEAKDPARRWVQGSTNGERRFIDDTEQSLLDQLDVQVVTRDTLLAEYDALVRERQDVLHRLELAKQRVRDAEAVARGTRDGFEILAKRNVPRPDRWNA